MTFNNTNDRLDTFLQFCVAVKRQYEDLWPICIIVFSFSHGHSNVVRGFSVNKEILVENLHAS